MTTFPTLFISHGAPNLVLHESPARDFFSGFGQGLGQKLGRPEAILIASAHFDMKIAYPAPGLPQLATVAASLVEQSGFPAQQLAGRGFDHGVWVPLSLMYPHADIPVVQIAIQADQGAGHHVALGRALAPLRKHGVLIIGSGSLTHNLEEVFHGDRDFDAPALDWVQDFDDWVLAKAEAGAIDDIADYRILAPHAKENHPTEEHFLPLAFAFGAAGEGAKGRRVHSSIQRGVMAMDAYVFE